MSTVHRVVESILNQDMSFERLVLWVSREPYLLDEGVNEPTSELAELMDRDSRFQMKWTDNTGPFRKLLPSLKEYGGTVVTADDDTLYPTNWLRGLLRLNSIFGNAVICYRGRRIPQEVSKDGGNYKQWRRYYGLLPSFQCFPTGKDGVLYPEGSVPDYAHDEKTYQKLCPKADDIWFKAVTWANGRKAYRLPTKRKDFPMCSQVDGLFESYNIKENDNQLIQTFEHFDLI